MVIGFVMVQDKVMDENFKAELGYRMVSDPIGIVCATVQIRPKYVPLAKIAMISTAGVGIDQTPSRRWGKTIIQCA
jgi:hypothetical protein